MLVAEFPDVRLAYEILNPQGSGLPLVLIMGWTGVKEDWGVMAERVAKHRPVLVFDNRGMGQSSVPDGPYDMDMLAHDTLRLLDHVGWPRAHLAGISMGGMIAQLLALRAPNRIERLILGCTSHGGPDAVAPDANVFAVIQSAQAKPDPRETVRAFLRINYTEVWIAAHPQRFEEAVEASLKYRRSRRGMMHQLAAILGFDTSPYLHAITQPTLILHGTDDQLLPYGNALRLREKIRSSHHLALPGAGHLFWEMDGGASAEAISAFLSE